jgi:hypothetical protein
MILRSHWVSRHKPQWNQNTAQRPLTSHKHIKNDHFRSSNKPSRGALAFERGSHGPWGAKRAPQPLHEDFKRIAQKIASRVAPAYTACLS